MHDPKSVRDQGIPKLSKFSSKSLALRFILGCLSGIETEVLQENYAALAEHVRCCFGLWSDSVTREQHRLTQELLKSFGHWSK